MGGTRKGNIQWDNPELERLTLHVLSHGSMVSSSKSS